MGERVDENGVEPCPMCGGVEWSTASDGLGLVTSVAAVCIGCGYLTTSVVDLTTPPAQTATEETR